MTVSLVSVAVPVNEMGQFGRPGAEPVAFAFQLMIDPESHASAVP